MNGRIPGMAWRVAKVPVRTRKKAINITNDLLNALTVNLVCIP